MENWGSQQVLCNLEAKLLSGWAEFELDQLKSKSHTLNSFIHDCFGIQGHSGCPQMILKYFYHLHLRISHSEYSGTGLRISVLSGSHLDPNPKCVSIKRVTLLLSSNFILLLSFKVQMPPRNLRLANNTCDKDMWQVTQSFNREVKWDMVLIRFTWNMQFTVIGKPLGCSC